MDHLVEKTISFMARNLQEIVDLPIDLKCINDWLIKQLSEKISIDTLDYLKDKRDKLQSRLFMKKVE